MLLSSEDWWQALTEDWRDLFLVNYVYCYRFGPTQRKSIVRAGVNPFTNYKLKFGKVFSPFEIDRAQLQEIVDLPLFYASECGLTDISPLAQCQQLEKLDVSANDLREWPSSVELSQLRTVYVDHNELPSLSFLERCDELAVVFARRNRLQGDFELGTTQRLSFIDVSMNELTNVACLQDCQNLTELQCSNNDLRDLGFLESHGTLEVLECAGNLLEDVSFLFAMPRLKYADISGNPIRREDYEWEELKARGVELVLE